MTNYIYLVYGEDDHCFNEAAYSIGTLRKWHDPASSRIVVFTDRPEKTKGWPVEHVSIAGKLEDMFGPAKFIHRAKICAILECFEKFPGNVFYLDSDTSINGDISRLAGWLAPGTAAMHHFECVNPEIGLAGFSTRLDDGASYQFSSDSNMHNAGVIAVHRKNCDVMGLALKLCDAILKFGSRRHTVEQFAVCEALRISNINILEARRFVTHYIQHKYYMRAKIEEMMRLTGLAPWRFEQPIPYSRAKVYWLRKFGCYLKPE